MDFTEIYEESIGLDTEGKAKSSVSLLHQIYNKLEDRLDTKNEYSLCNPEVALNNTEVVTEIQLIFNSPSDSDLKIIWTMIQMLNQDALTDAQTNENNYHILVLNIVPNKYNGQYFIAASTPLFVSVKSLAPNEKANIISFVFKNEDVMFYETDDIDIAEIESEVKREMLEEQRLEEVAERKRQEREEFYENRNKTIRDRRHF